MADDVLAIARRLLALGLSVIPVPRPRPGVAAGHPGDGKVPVLAWREYQTRRPTDAELVAWFGGAPMNIAIITGEISGVVVVDADAREALRWCTRHLKYTPWQTKTSHGYHLWYRHPGVRVRNRARIATPNGKLPIDVRGDGGYVVGPTSVHASGAVYTFVGDWPATREHVPFFWPGWLQRSERPPRTAPSPASRPPSDLLTRARAYLAAIPVPVIGAGSDTATLSAACRLVRGFELSAADAEHLLWQWAGGRPGWTREWIAQKVAHAERYGSEPIGRLR
jgi:hypothetical protein